MFAEDSSPKWRNEMESTICMESLLISMYEQLFVYVCIHMFCVYVYIFVWVFVPDRLETLGKISTSAKNVSCMSWV